LLFVERTGFTSWVNLNHARTAEPVKGSSPARLMLFDAEKRSLGEVYAVYLPRSETVVPAPPGTMALVVEYWDTRDGRPTEDGIEVRRTPIVAWRVPAGGGIPVGSISVLADPVLVEPVLNGAVLYWELPNGALATLNRDYPNSLDDGKAAVLRWAQQDWDIKQAKAEKACRAQVVSAAPGALDPADA